MSGEKKGYELEDEVFPEDEDEMAAFGQVCGIVENMLPDEDDESEDNGQKTLRFHASLPEIQSAISVGGDGARLKLDVPETDLPEVLKLAAFGRGKVLKIELVIEG